jgi:hypothetical protein
MPHCRHLAFLTRRVQHCSTRAGCAQGISLERPKISAARLASRDRSLIVKPVVQRSDSPGRRSGLNVRARTALPTRGRDCGQPEGCGGGLRLPFAVQPPRRRVTPPNVRRSSTISLGGVPREPTWPVLEPNGIAWLMMGQVSALTDAMLCWAFSQIDIRDSMWQAHAADHRSRVRRRARRPLRRARPPRSFPSKRLRNIRATSHPDVFSWGRPRRLQPPSRDPRPRGQDLSSRIHRGVQALERASEVEVSHVEYEIRSVLKLARLPLRLTPHGAAGRTPAGQGKTRHARTLRQPAGRVWSTLAADSPPERSHPAVPPVPAF